MKFLSFLPLATGAERPANSVNMGIYLFALDWSTGRGFFYWSYKS